MREPWRFWLTGGVAAVLAAASQDGPAGEARRSSRASRYSLKETADRLEQQAREHGLSVFARLSPPTRRTRHRVYADGGAEPTALLLVLGVDPAHTLVLQSTPEAGLDLPLTVLIEQRDGGPIHVEFIDSSWLAECDELPRELVYPVTRLPQLVDAALM